MKRGILAILLFLTMLSVGSDGVAGEEGQKGYQFLLGPGDLLEISVWKDEALSRQVVVTPDGMVSFPLIGDIVAKGRTVNELREAIQSKIVAYVPDAPVNVMIVQVGSQKVYVVGKVNKPGMYIMVEPLRVMQVLAMAGGMTSFAKKDDIIIIRSEGHEQKVFPFDYTEVSEGENLAQNMVLQPGDTVVVP